MSENPTILILGTGSLASLFAAKLSESNVDITMLGSWREGLEAINKSGVRLVQSDGKEQIYSVQAIDNPEDCIGIKYALVLVKSWGTERAAQNLAKCLASDGLALTLQNGIGNREILANALGEERVALGSITYGANLIQPGKVRLAGEGTITLTNQHVTSSIGEILRKAGFQVEYTKDASGLIWGKLLINAVINPLTALLEVPNGELLKYRTTRDLMVKIVNETLTVIEAQRITLPFSNPIKVVEGVAQRTATNRSSMLQDISRGTPTEIDFINGAVVKYGGEYNLATPVNEILWQLVKAKEEVMKKDLP